MTATGRRTSEQLDEADLSLLGVRRPMEAVVLAVRHDVIRRRGLPGRRGGGKIDHRTRRRW